jgi:hypothetical protein
VKRYQKFILGFVMALLAVAGCYIYGNLQHTVYRQYFPIQTALAASILYIHEYGEPPRSVSDLIRTKCVKQDGDGFVNPYMFLPRCANKHFYKVHLSFPKRADELEIKDGRLIDKSSKADRYLAVIMPHDLIEVDQMKVSVDIWKDWVKLERGEKIDWLEAAAAERQKEVVKRE